jgi:hypothetical protein
MITTAKDKVVNSIPAENNGGDGKLHTPLDCVTEVSLQDRTQALLQGLHLILKAHGAKDVVRESLDLQMRDYLDNSQDEGTWLKRTKYVLTYPLAKYLKNPLPKKPDLDFKPSGRLRSWMKPRLSFFNRKNTHLWYSWFQSKRSTLPLSEDVVEQSYEDHLKSLTRDPPSCKDVVNEIFKDETFLKVLRDVRRKIFERSRSNKIFTDFSPSVSASWENTRSAYGQSGTLDDLVGIGEDERSALAFQDLDYMVCYPVVHSHDTRYNVVKEYHSWPGHSEWSQLERHRELINPSKGPLKCKIQAVLEPNKVRIISKGESLPYYSCKPLQRAMHDSLRTMPCFKLLDRPFSVADVLDLKKKSSDTDKWLSIDYSAATDGLSIRYSEKIFHFLMNGLSQIDYDIAKSVLGLHSLYYPVRDSKDSRYGGEQTNGQLMGSILSFPILCLANLGVYLYVTRDYQSGWSHFERLSHVMINGDDMVYAASEMVWNDHIRVSGSVGLEMSVGKAYLHDTYLNVNSTSVHCDLRCPNSTPWRIDYLNTGLYYGRHKVQGDGKSELIPSLNTLLEGALPGKKKSLLIDFLNDHHDEILKETEFFFRGKKFHRNLFIPISLGGMGIIPPLGFKYYTTAMDRYIAFHMLRSNSCKYSFMSPVPGFIPIQEKIFDRPWRKSQKLLSSFPEELEQALKSIPKKGSKMLKRSLTKYIPIRYSDNRVTTLL